MVTSTYRRRLAASLTAGGLLLLPLTACSGSTTSDGSTAEDGPAATATADGSAEAGAPTQGSGAPPTENSVDCSLSECTVTLAGDGAEVEVLGNTVSLGSVQDGRATIGVAGNEFSCSQGESISAGPLSIECTTVTPQGIALTASLG
jgi:hypothetical protein